MSSAIVNSVYFQKQSLIFSDPSTIKNHYEEAVQVENWLDDIFPSNQISLQMETAWCLCYILVWTAIHC